MKQGEFNVNLDNFSDEQLIRFFEAHKNRLKKLDALDISLKFQIDLEEFEKFEDKKFQKKVFERLLEKLGSNPAQIVDPKKGDTFLHKICQLREDPIMWVESFYASYSEKFFELVNTVNRWNWTPLAEAVSRGYFETILFLLNKGAKTDIIPKEYENYRTFLEWAESTSVDEGKALKKVQNFLKNKDWTVDNKLLSDNIAAKILDENRNFSVKKENKKNEYETAVQEEEIPFIDALGDSKPKKPIEIRAIVSSIEMKSVKTSERIIDRPTKGDARGPLKKEAILSLTSLDALRTQLNSVVTETNLGEVGDAVDVLLAAGRQFEQTSLPKELSAEELSWSLQIINQAPKPEKALWHAVFCYSAAYQLYSRYSDQLPIAASRIQQPLEMALSKVNDSLSKSANPLLHQLVRMNDLPLLDYVLRFCREKFKLNAKEKDFYQKTALYTAAELKETALAKRLIEFDPDSITVGKMGERSPGTVLHAICLVGDEILLEYLARQPKFQSIVNVKQSEGHGGETALHLAAKGGYFMLIRRLLVLGADPREKNALNYYPVEEWMANSPIQDIEQHDNMALFLLEKTYPDKLDAEEGERLLHYCCESGLFKTAHALILTKKVDPLFKERREAHLGVVVHALDLTVSGENELKKQENYIAIIQLLIDQGVSLTQAMGRYTYKLLHFSADRGLKALVSYLLRKGVDPAEMTAEGNLPLHYAAAAKPDDPELVSFLSVDRENNSLSNKVNQWGLETPLHWAAKAGNARVVEWFLEKAGASMNSQDRQGNTPLHLAVNQRIFTDKHRMVVRCLLSHHADPTIRNKQNQLPIDLAKKVGDEGTVDELTLYQDSFVFGKKHTREPSHYSMTPKKLPINSLAIPERYTTLGLEHKPVTGDGHCFFTAVGLYLNETQDYLRRIVTAHIEQNLQKYRNIIQALNPNKTVERYLNDLRSGVEWADNIEISVLMRVLDRPIVVLDPNGKIRNQADLHGNGEPIFVYYNGHDHYDGLLCQKNTGRTILEALTEDEDTIQKKTEMPTALSYTESNKKHRYVLAHQPLDALLKAGVEAGQLSVFEKRDEGWFLHVVQEGQYIELPIAIPENWYQTVPQGYDRHPVKDSGDCGYTAFGITRQEAISLLRQHITAIRDLIKPAVKAVLLTQEFYHYLQEKEAITDTVTFEAITKHMDRWAKNLSIIEAYLTYDAEDKRIDAGWAHPCVLQALAHIQKIELRLWRLGAQSQLIPHKDIDYDYAVYQPPSATSRTDLLFINNNHFERLEFEGYSEGLPDGSLPIYALRSPAEQAAFSSDPRTILMTLYQRQNPTTSTSHYVAIEDRESMTALNILQTIVLSKIKLSNPDKLAMAFHEKVNKPILKTMTTGEENRDSTMKKNKPLKNKNRKNYQQGKELIAAAGAGDIGKVKGLLNKAVYIDYSERSGGNTALYLAAQYGHEAIVDLLIKAGATIDIRADEKRWSPLLIAAQTGHNPIITLLIENGADVKDSNNTENYTPLHAAAYGGFGHTIELLLSYESSLLEEKATDGWTALHIAVRWGHKFAVEALLKKGANIEALTTALWTPLHLAAKNNHSEIYKLLLAYGADASKKDKFSKSAKEYLMLSDFENYPVFTEDRKMSVFLSQDNTSLISTKTTHIEKTQEEIFYELGKVASRIELGATCMTRTDSEAIGIRPDYLRVYKRFVLFSHRLGITLSTHFDSNSPIESLIESVANQISLNFNSQFFILFKLGFNIERGRILGQAKERKLKEAFIDLVSLEDMRIPLLELGLDEEIITKVGILFVDHPHKGFNHAWDSMETQLTSQLFSKKAAKTRPTEKKTRIANTLFQGALHQLKALGLAEQSPSLFLVYAHEQKISEAHPADAEIAQRLLDWLDNELGLHCRSDVNPIGKKKQTAESLSETELKLKTDILYSQLCLLPESETSVEYVILCGSQCLGQLIQQPIYQDYSDAIIRALSSSERRRDKTLYSEIKGVVRAFDKQIRDNTALNEPLEVKQKLHQLYTELCFLKKRVQYPLTDYQPTVVPLLLNGDRETALPQFVTSTDIYIGQPRYRQGGFWKKDPVLEEEGLYLGFFNLLKRLFAKTPSIENRIEAIETGFKQGLSLLKQDQLSEEALQTWSQKLDAQDQTKKAQDNRDFEALMAVGLNSRLKKSESVQSQSKNDHQPSVVPLETALPREVVDMQNKALTSN